MQLFSIPETKEDHLTFVKFAKELEHTKNLKKFDLKLLFLEALRPYAP